MHGRRNISDGGVSICVHPRMGQRMGFGWLMCPAELPPAPGALAPIRCARAWDAPGKSTSVNERPMPQPTVGICRAALDHQGCTPPVQVLEIGVSSIAGASYFSFGGAELSWPPAFPTA